MPVTSPTDAFSAAEMFRQLEQAPPLAMTGMVKRSESDKSVILFSPSSDCSNWIEIPERFVLKFESLGKSACGDHSHFVVKLYLLPPETPEGQIFLQATAQRPSPLAIGPSMENGLASMLARHRLNADFSVSDRSPCFYDWSLGWVRRDGTPC